MFWSFATFSFVRLRMSCTPAPGIHGLVTMDRGAQPDDIPSFCGLVAGSFPWDDHQASFWGYSLAAFGGRPDILSCKYTLAHWLTRSQGT